jgi:hypothetical protein
MTTDLATLAEPIALEPVERDLSNDAPRDPRKCSAHSARTGKPCKRYAIAGGTVCPTHGGSAPQVKEAAMRRLEDGALIAANALVTIAGKGSNEAARVRAADSLLDRVGVGRDETAQDGSFRELLIRVREYSDR